MTISGYLLGRGWYLTTSLLSFPHGEDRNKRHLFCGTTWIRTFNDEMMPWEEWQDEALQRACDELNRAERIEL
jgi:hypothetical protein